MMDQDVKQESSIPVQTRVSFMSLAKLHVYWTLEGYHIRTMSQLVGWSVDLLCEVLEANEKMPDQIETLAEAHRYLQYHGLYQGSMKERSMKKIGTALRFETMREQGQDPQHVIPVQHKMLHKKTSVKPLENTVDAGLYNVTSNEEWERIQERIKEENKKDAEIAKEKAIKNAKAAGLVVSEPEEELEKLCLEEARAKYFKTLAKVKREHPELSEEAAKDMAQAEIKNETFVSELGYVVKEEMNDEEYEAKLEEIAKRDRERLDLENAPFEASDLPMVDDKEDNDSE